MIFFFFGYDHYYFKNADKYIRPYISRILIMQLAEWFPFDRQQTYTKTKLGSYELKHMLNKQFWHNVYFFSEW